MSNGAETRIRRSRAKILAAAEAAFLSHGYAETSMDAVAEAADVSKQTLYARFGSKEDLFRAVIAAMTGPTNTILQPDFDSLPDDVEQVLSTFARDQLRIVLTPRLMKLRRLAIAEAERFPDLGRALYESGPKMSINWLARVIGHFAARGALRVTDAPKAAGFFNWLLMGEPTNDVMFLGEAALPDADWCDGQAREAVRIFLAAYGVNPGG